MDRGYVSFDLFRKMSGMGLVFVTRLKKNMVYEVREEHAVPNVGGLVSDRMKQNLEIESFMGTSQNAVETQIYASMISMLLLKELKEVSDSKRKEANLKPFGFSSFVTSIRPSLCRITPLENWLQKPFAPPDDAESSGQLALFPPGFLGQQAVPKCKITPRPPWRW